MTAWCPTCGLVRDVDEPLPLCRHNIGTKIGPPPTRMEPLPPGHPLAPGGKDAG